MRNLFSVWISSNALTSFNIEQTNVAVYKTRFNSRTRENTSISIREACFRTK